MKRHLSIEWQRQIERPDWDAIKDEPWASPTIRYMETNRGVLIGTCDDPGLLMPIIEGRPFLGGQTRFDVYAPDNWKNDRIFFNGLDMGLLGFRVMMDPGDYRTVAPKADTNDYIRVGRVQCATASEWIDDIFADLGTSPAPPHLRGEPAEEAGFRRR